LDKLNLLKEINSSISKCDKCILHEGRTMTVPGEGDVNSPVMFVGEGPGREEDLSGSPFVGRAGKLLTNILKAVKLERKDVFISNIVKCRPPNNRTPLFEEMETCYPFLKAQIQLIKPKLIVTLGSASLSYLIGKKRISITKMRGEIIKWKYGIDIFPMLHPSYLLRNQSNEPGSPKYLTWQDIKEVRRLFDEYKI